MIIKPLEEFREYEENIAEGLFAEWTDLYISKTKYKTKDLLLNNYIKESKTHYVAFDKINNEYIGSYCFYKSLFNLYLADVYVSSKYRKKGYGSKMINNAIQYAIDNNYSDLYLYTDKDELIKFYRKIGFESDNHIDSLNRTRMVMNLKKKYNYKILIFIVFCVIIFWMIF